MTVHVFSTNSLCGCNGDEMIEKVRHKHKMCTAAFCKNIFLAKIRKLNEHINSNIGYPGFTHNVDDFLNRRVYIPCCWDIGNSYKPSAVFLRRGHNNNIMLRNM